jgi:hypothetical protein
MRKICLAASVVALLYLFNACKKSDNPAPPTGPSNAKTVANFSGTYNLKDLKASVLGVTIDLFDSLPACDTDNIIRLNSDLTAQFIDTGVVCSPPSDSTGIWGLSQNTDTLYVAGTANLITSWDGITLVLAGNQVVDGFPAMVTTTLVKK